MRYDLIALDLDGTALNPACAITPAVREAVQWARRRGVRVVVATGRICSEAADFARMMDADDEMVTSGGAALSSVSKNCCLFRTPMRWEEASKAAAACEASGLSSMVYVAEKLYMTTEDEKFFSGYKSNEGYLAARTAVPSVAETIVREQLSVDKIFTRAVTLGDPANAERIARLRAALKPIENIRVLSSGADNVEVISPQANKARALEHLCRRYNTSLEHAIAIGDSENDLDMLEAVGMPVAMGNARDDVKEMCRFVTKTNAEDGVAHAIYTLLGK